MIKTRLVKLFYCFSGSVLLVVTLFGFSKWESLHPNGFLRKIPSHMAVGLGFIKLQNKSFYFVGGDSGNIYLRNWAYRNKLLKVNCHSKDSSSIKIFGTDTSKFYEGIYVRTSLSNIYLCDGIKPVLISGDLKSGKMDAFHQAVYFTSSVPLSPTSYILRVVGKNKTNTLIKLFDGKITESYMLERQGDGIFSTDGTLIWSADGSRIFYTYYYRNQFLCLDTNLNVLYNGKTIDTVSTANIKVGEIKSANEITLASPPLFVNEQSAANDAYFFVHSALQADNETGNAFRKVSPLIFITLETAIIFLVFT
jgi:hypothetical protein